MVKLKKGTSLHANLQNVVVATINDPNYSFSLPKLSDWESVVSSSADEKQRLEFVGDAIMHLSVALYLYRLFPDGAPGFYTSMRSALNANATFAHLMVKAGAYELSSQSHATKAVADSFEVIVAALYLERGFADVCVWVQEQYAPLIAAVRESYDRCLSTSNLNAPPLSRKRHRGQLNYASTPLLEKIRLSSGRVSPRLAQRVINRMKSKGKIKLCLPTKKSKPPLEMRLHSCKLRTSESERSSSLVIDLTLENESDGERAVPSSVAHVPRHNIEPLILSQRLSPLQSDIAPQSVQNPDECAGLRLPLKPDSTASLPRLQSSPGPSSPTLPPIATIVPRLTAVFLERRDLSPSSQLDSIHIVSGMHGNPIIIEDSESEG